MKENDVAPTWEMASVRYAAPLISLSIYDIQVDACMTSSYAREYQWIAMVLRPAVCNRTVPCKYAAEIGFGHVSNDRHTSWA